MNKQPFVSVVIATYNRREMLKECLDSLFKQTYPKDMYEIIVVNDGSTDGTRKVLEEYAEKAPCKLKWFNQKNQGISAAMNARIKNSEGKIICFTGDDCIADKNWIRNLADSFSDETIGGVGGEVVACNLETIIEKYTEERGVLNQEKFRSINFIITGNAAYRKEVLTAIGGFDTNLISCDDIDISIMAQLKGYTLKYNPKAIIYHRHIPTLKGLIRRQYDYGRGYAQLHRKYTKDFNPSYTIALLTLRMINKIVTYPPRFFKVFFVKDRIYYLSESFLDLIVVVSNLSGIIKETLFGEKYTGEKINQKLDFVEEQSMSALVGKIYRKLV